MYYSGANISVYQEQLFIHLELYTFYGEEDLRNTSTSELVIWDGTQFQDFGRPFSLKPGNSIVDLSVLKDVLYVMGNFDKEVLGTRTDGMVTWDGRQWGVIPDGTGASITAMQEFQDKLYLASLFGFTQQIAIWQP